MGREKKGGRKRRDEEVLQEFSVYKISSNLKMILLQFFGMARPLVLPRGAFSRDVSGNPFFSMQTSFIARLELTSNIINPVKVNALCRNV